MNKIITLILTVILFASMPFGAAHVEAGSVDGNALTLSFESNPTTGFEWTAFVMSGDSAVIDESASGYVAAENKENLDGVGGTHYFTINAVQPGDTLIRFSYGRGWTEEGRDNTYILVTVDETGAIYAADITESGVITGTVVSVDAEENSVLLVNEAQGEMVARFYDDIAMPVEGEEITIFTNGTMTMSLPPIVNVIAWETVPGEMAR